MAVHTCQCIAWKYVFFNFFGNRFWMLYDVQKGHKSFCRNIHGRVRCKQDVVRYRKQGGHRRHLQLGIYVLCRCISGQKLWKYSSRIDVSLSFNFRDRGKITILVWNRLEMRMKESTIFQNCQLESSGTQRWWFSMFFGISNNRQTNPKDNLNHSWTLRIAKGCQTNSKDIFQTLLDPKNRQRIPNKPSGHISNSFRPKQLSKDRRPILRF